MKAPVQLFAVLAAGLIAWAEAPAYGTLFVESASATGLTFTHVTGAAGQYYMAEVMGAGAALFDYDNDGDLDVFIVNHGAKPILYRNDGGNDNDWLKIKLQGTASNRDGIGAFITVDPDANVVGDEMVREINAGSNFLSQNELTAHFGLGPDAGIVDFITIVWPSGTVQELSNVSANQLLNLVENLLPGDYNGDHVVNSADYTVWRDQLGSMGSGYAADGNGDQMVTQLDYSVWKAHFGATASGFGSSASSRSIPEPSTRFLWWIGFAVTSLMRRSGR
jgi:hypothetical protein